MTKGCFESILTKKTRNWKLQAKGTISRRKIDGKRLAPNVDLLRPLVWSRKMVWYYKVMFT